jgi:hypothetical protein
MLYLEYKDCKIEEAVMADSRDVSLEKNKTLRQEILAAQKEVEESAKSYQQLAEEIDRAGENKGDPNLNTRRAERASEHLKLAKKVSDLQDELYANLGAMDNLLQQEKRTIDYQNRNKSVDIHTRTVDHVARVFSASDDDKQKNLDGILEKVRSKEPDPQQLTMVLQRDMTTLNTQFIDRVEKHKYYLYSNFQPPGVTPEEWKLIEMTGLSDIEKSKLLSARVPSGGHVFPSGGHNDQTNVILATDVNLDSKNDFLYDLVKKYNPNFASPEQLYHSQHHKTVKDAIDASNELLDKKFEKTPVSTALTSGPGGPPGNNPNAHFNSLDRQSTSTSPSLLQRMKTGYTLTRRNLLDKTAAEAGPETKEQTPKKPTPRGSS